MGEIDIVISKKDGQDQEVASSLMNEDKGDFLSSKKSRSNNTLATRRLIFSGTCIMSCFICMCYLIVSKN